MGSLKKIQIGLSIGTLHEMKNRSHKLEKQEQPTLAISGLIRECRKRANMTQIELAERVGTKQANISRMENLYYTHHNIEMLRRIAEALSCRLVVEMVPYDQDNNSA